MAPLKVGFTGHTGRTLRLESERSLAWNSTPVVEFLERRPTPRYAGLVYREGGSRSVRRGDSMYEARQETLAEDAGVLIWHPEIHRQLLHEQAAFLTIGFQPRYQRDAALQVLDRAASSIGVRSFTVWELQRKPDVLLRAWLPAGKNTDDLWAALRTEARTLSHLPLEVSGTTFAVLRTLTHHFWPRGVNPSDLDDVVEAGGDFLTSGALSGELPQELSLFVKRHLAARTSHNSTGIKFFIWLAVSELLPNERARTSLEQELLRVVQATQHVYATSVYVGQSSTADYLVSGRVKPEHYEALAKELQPRLAGLGEPFFATNTDTGLSTLFGPIDRVEALLAPDEYAARSGAPRPTAQADLAELLSLDESEELEFKGSAFTPIDIADPSKVSDAELANRRKKVREAITKSCAGFLNGGGGVLVIGVLEAGRTSDVTARRYSPTAEQIGKYVVVGVDRYTDGKGDIGWDDFELRLRAHLRESITPSPDPWISIRKLEWNGLDIAAVIVAEPNTWFWATTATDSDVFYVRYGNATRPLKGAAQYHHLQSKPERKL